MSLTGFIYFTDIDSDNDGDSCTQVHQADSLHVATSNELHLYSEQLNSEEAISDDSHKSLEETSSDSSMDEENVPIPMDTNTKIRRFCIKYNLSRSACNELLDILTSEGINISKTHYKLYSGHFCDNYKVQPQPSNAELAYVSLKDNLQFLRKKGFLTDNMTQLSLKVNIDGLPLFKSSSTQAWPVLFTVDGINMTPLPIACYVGQEKPQFKDFTNSLVAELNQFKGSFQEISPGFSIKLARVIFVCDCPARSFLQQIKGHTSYDGCSFCRIQGKFEDKRIIYPYEENLVLRTDDAYRDNEEENQRAYSPFIEISSFQNDVPPEYMHLVCLGVVKKLLKVFAGVHSVPGLRIRGCAVTKAFEKYKMKLPSEFQRQIRHLRDVCHFKATECRSWLLYVGPVILKEVLPARYYQHFLLLHYAIYILCNPSWQSLYDHAHACLKRFVYQLGQLFGHKFWTYNSHNLLHLTHFVKSIGPLDDFSAFRFEALLYHLKRSVRSGNKVLPQLMKSLLNQREFCCRNENKMKVTNVYPNNFAIVEEGQSIFPIEVSSVEGSCISGFQMTLVENLYDSPYLSSTLSIGVFKRSDTYVSKCKMINKCVAFLHGQCVILIPYARSDVF